MRATAPAQRLVGVIQRAGTRTATDDEFFAEVSDAVAKDVPFDGSMWFGVDPSTLLATSPARVENMDAEYCWPFWHAEFNDHDALLFRDLARQPVPVASLRMAMSDHPLRSPRYREFMKPQGYDDEARVAFRTGSTTWAVAGLYREQGRRAFDADDLHLLLDISSAVGAALRARNLLQSPSAGSLLSPGVLMFNANGVLLSANLEARAWLGEIFGPEGDGETWAGLLARCSFPDQLKNYPLMHSLVARARAVALGYDEGPARLRLRDRGGRWLVMHASCLDETAVDGPVAVVVEPAKSAEIAPLIVEAYQLSPRERDVVRGVARGLSTPEIATELFLSSHTVRDYIKSVFEKVGVSSRGELIAKLFAEHYSDALHASMVHTG